MTEIDGAGVVIGRFMPPHVGHEYLIHFASSFCDPLYVFVCTLHDEPIPGELRYRWMRELFPSVRVIHITEEIPEAARSSSGAHEIWAQAVRSRIDVDPKFVFASEHYGLDLARALGATFVPVDPRREAFPISAGAIRSNPLAHWHYLPGIVRPYFAKKVVVLESTGRLVRELATKYDTLFAGEYPQYIDSLDLSEPLVSHAEHLVRAQAASEAALVRETNRVLFTGTDSVHLLLGRGIGHAEASRIVTSIRSTLPSSAPDLIVSAGPVGEAYRNVVATLGWELVVTGNIDEARTCVVERVDRWLIGNS